MTAKPTKKKSAKNNAPKAGKSNKSSPRPVGPLAPVEKPRAFLMEHKVGTPRTGKPILTTESREPSTTIVCNLREQMERPWVFKIGSDKLQDIVKKAKNQRDERKGDWFKTIGETIVEHTSYSPIPEAPFGWDTLGFGDACELIFEAINEEYRLANAPPKQKTIGETE